MCAALVISQVTQLPVTPINPHLEEQGPPAFADESEDRQLLDKLNSMKELKYLLTNLLLQTEELIITLALQTDMLAITLPLQTVELVITLAMQTDMLAIPILQTEELVITLPLQTDLLVITHHQLTEENAIPLLHQLKEHPISLLHQLKQVLALILHQLQAEWIVLLLQHSLSLGQRKLTIPTLYHVKNRKFSKLTSLPYPLPQVTAQSHRLNLLLGPSTSQTHQEVGEL